jgi:hypothetical protein
MLRLTGIVRINENTKKTQSQNSLNFTVYWKEIKNAGFNRSESD